MGLANNTGFGPPPLGTPITGETGDQFGVPFQNRPKEPIPAGNLAIGWAAWFAALWQRIFGNSPMVIDQPLTSTSAAIAVPAANVAADLVVILRPDGSGLPATVWGAGFSAISSDIDAAAGTVSVFRCTYSPTVGLWLQSAQHTTGMNP